MRTLPFLLVACVVALASLAAAPAARATETDQFTLPPAPLDDLGPDLGAIVLDILRAEVAQLNVKIDERIQLNQRPDPDATIEAELVKHVYEQTGVGLPESTAGM